jgi:hypothetical protein
MVNGTRTAVTKGVNSLMRTSESVFGAKPENICSLRDLPLLTPKAVIGLAVFSHCGEPLTDPCQPVMLSPWLGAADANARADEVIE